MESILISLLETGGASVAGGVLVILFLWLYDKRGGMGSVTMTDLRSRRDMAADSDDGGRSPRLSLQQHKDLCPLNREDVMTKAFCEKQQEVYRGQVDQVREEIRGVGKKVDTLFDKFDQMEHSVIRHLIDTRRVVAEEIDR